jgi:hypothetical protein
MFSFSINNPNNFVILNDNKNNYNVIPFGHRCTSAIACKYSNIRKMSLPFDWNLPLFPSKIQNVLTEDFNDFIPNVWMGIFHNKYDIHLCHFNSDINSGVEEYKRRIDRFNNIINCNEKIYFVYINEDYLYDNNFRGDEFNDKIFNEMLELEQFLRNKYSNIDYNILYFNFKNHNIPQNSNIINIVLNSNNLFDRLEDSPYDEFRIYCGQILANLFNTTMTVKPDYNTFNF